MDVLLITFNGKRHLERLLPSLRKTSYPNFRVLLLDNSSNDEASDFAKAEWPNLVHLRFGKNLGFAKANNEGFKRSFQDGADYCLLLNDDTEILASDWIERAITFIEQKEDCGTVGFRLHSDLDQYFPPPTEFAREIEFVQGCSLLISLDTLRRIGLLDEAYFAYYEESDLQMRMRKVELKPFEIDVPLLHVGSGTFGADSGLQQYLMLRNSVRFHIKNTNFGQGVKELIKFFFYGVFPIDLCKTPGIRPLRKRFYRTKYAFRNLVFLGRATVWNLVRLPNTLMLRHSVLDSMHGRKLP